MISSHNDRLWNLLARIDIALKTRLGGMSGRGLEIRAPINRAGYQMTPDVLAAFSVDNLLNENYTKYMCCSTQAG